MKIIKFKICLPLLHTSLSLCIVNFSAQAALADTVFSDLERNGTIKTSSSYKSSCITHEPSTVDEAINIIIQAKKNINKTAENIRCSDNKSTTGIDIKKLRRIIKLDKFNEEETVLAESGTKLYELTQWLHRKNRSLGFSIPGNTDITLMQAIKSSAHGSSIIHDSIFASKVVSLELIAGDGKINIYNKSSSDKSVWQKLISNPDDYGLLTRVRISVQPQYNIEVKVTYNNENELFEKNGIINSMKSCDLSLINWFPSVGKFIKTCGIKTEKSSDIDAVNNIRQMMYRSAIDNFSLIKQSGLCDRDFLKTLAAGQWKLFKEQPPFTKKTPLLHISHNSSHVTGPSHIMQSGLQNDIKKSRHAFYVHRQEIAIPLIDSVAALKALNDYFDIPDTSVPLTGVTITATRAASDLAVSENPFKTGTIFIEMPTYESADFNKDTNSCYQNPYRGAAKMLLSQFEGATQTE